MRIGIQWTSESRRRFSGALKTLTKTTRKEAWNTLNRMAMFTAFSAEKAARLGKARRRVVTARSKLEQRQMGGKYAIRNYSVSQAKKAARHWDTQWTNGWWITSRPETRDYLRDIMFRGAAKASWAGIKRKLGAKTVRVQSDMLRTVLYRTNWVRFNKGSPMSIIISNTLRYMAKIQPTILTDAIEKAKRRLAGLELKQVERRLERTWRRAA